MSQQPHLPHIDATPAAAGPVTCLGLTFPDDAARRAYFSDRLAEHLQDPAFRQIEGFPIGADEDILALSDPPYYTACPNPFLAEIIAQWQGEREKTRAALGLPADGENGAYQREPFAADVSEGKNDPIYNAHSYHTKVPHKAIMRYILHYTDPGDIVFDGFCGTGMTGVAAQLCGDRKAVQELGYRVENDGVIYDGNAAISRLGARKAVLNDLSPAATFIAYNYNTPVDTAAFETEARRILAEMEAELGWMYETWHPHCDHPQRVKGKIDYTAWSEVFLCTECGKEIVFLDEALDTNTGKVAAEFFCPQCKAMQSKRHIDRLFTTYVDPLSRAVRRKVTFRPILISYSLGGKGRYQKSVDANDLETLARIDEIPLPNSIPSDRFPIERMYHGSRLAPKGFEYIHDLYLRRQAISWGNLWLMAAQVTNPRIVSALYFMLDQALFTGSMLNAYRPTGFSQVSQYMKGVYYVPAQVSEVSPAYVFSGKLGRLVNVFSQLEKTSISSGLSTASATARSLPAQSVDYIFTDPPFGENIFYADLNLVPESWHRVKTATDVEVIIDRPKAKSSHEYLLLMRQVFQEYFRVLRDGRWATVEFHNSSNSVWNAIQEAILSAGFVVADVRILDKQQGSYRQVTAASVAKQDLVISAYKPAASFERSFQREAGTAEGAWHFVRQHLAKLPVVVQQDGVLETLGERQDYLLFDRMVAFHIQRGATVPLSAAEFYAGLRSRFVERDGMFFLPDQVPEYDRARLQAGQVAQLTLFVNDEKSSVQWLRQQLDPAVGGQPQTYQELQPQFLRQLHQARHEALPELSTLLEQNFLQDDQGRWYVPDPNRAGDLEALRLKGLLREFRSYVEGKKKLKQFRSEAVRAGFAHAWRERDFATIVAVAGRLPEQVLQEDAELLMYYDNASLRVG